LFDATLKRAPAASVIPRDPGDQSLLSRTLSDPRDNARHFLLVQIIFMEEN
jgi:hypothetical protein